MLLRSLKLLAFTLQPLLAFAEETGTNTDEPCMVHVGERIRNLQQKKHGGKQEDGRRGDHVLFATSSQRKHRRMVSVEIPVDCDRCDVINVDMPHDGVTMSFNKVKSTSPNSTDMDTVVSSQNAFSHWSGIEASNGSFFNFVQDDGGHLAGSLVDLTRHNVLQFHSTHDGEYAVTITPSSHFPPEDDPRLPDDASIVGVEVGGRKLGVKRGDENRNNNTLPTFLSANTQSNQGTVSSKLFLGPLKENLSKQVGRNLYDDLGGNLDVMVVWTKKAECATSILPSNCILTSTTEANMRALIDLAVSETNTAYENSNIDTELLLVHAYRHPMYVESSFSQSLDDITVGNLAGVHSDRFSYGADIVVLIIDDPQYCGMAHLGPHIDLMYSVTAWNCATGYFSFGHEIGHNLGCYHDRGNQNTCSDLSRYHFGWRDPNANFRTILAYNCVSGECDNNVGGGCSRVPYFSNPNTLYNNQAVGDANNDNARQINEVRAAVAKYYSHGFNTLAPISMITPAPVAPPPSAVCGDGNCQVNYGEGCGSCSSDCFLPTNCNYVAASFYQPYIDPNVYGIVFDVSVGSRDLYFYELLGYTLLSTTAKVYMKNGSHTSDSNLLQWTKVFDGTVTPTVMQGSNYRALMDFSSARFYAPAESTVAVYISYGLGRAIWFGQTLSFSNSDVSVQNSNLVRQQLSENLPLAIASGWSFLDTIRYDYAPEPTASPTKAPAPLITPAPTITLADLNEWYISQIGDAIEEVSSSDTILIYLPFNASNREIGALVYKDDCVTSFDSDKYFVAGTTEPRSRASDGFINFNTTLTMNITAINASTYWNPFSDGTRGGWVQACVETFLMFTDKDNLGNGNSQDKVEFKNNVLNISVFLTATYDVDEVSVVREEETEENIKTEYSEFIDAYQCDESDPFTKVTATYSQGDQITICVTDDGTGIVQVEEFVNLVVAQDGISDYNFILNTLYNPDITTPICLDATVSKRKVCFVKIRALARFFQSKNTKELTISGSVYVIRDGLRVRRSLRMALPIPEKINDEEDHNALAVVAGRRIEEDQGSGQFRLQVSLSPADDNAASNRIIGSAVGVLVSMAVGAAGAILIT